MSVRPSIRLSVCQLVHQSFHSSVIPSFCLFFCLSVHLSFCKSPRLSVCFSVYLYICLFICLHVCLSICTSVFLHVFTSVYLFVRLNDFKRGCLCVCLYICVPFDMNSCKFVKSICLALQATYRQCVGMTHKINGIFSASFGKITKPYFWSGIFKLVLNYSSGSLKFFLR